MFSDKLPFLAGMGLGNVAPSRHVLLGLSDKDTYISANKKGLINFEYKEIHKSGSSSDKLDMVFPVSVQLMKERKHLLKFEENCFNHFGVARIHTTLY